MPNQDNRPYPDSKLYANTKLNGVRIADSNSITVNTHTTGYINGYPAICPDPDCNGRHSDGGDHADRGVPAGHRKRWVPAPDVPVVFAYAFWSVVMVFIVLMAFWLLQDIIDRWKQ